MICPACEHDNLPGSDLCAHCGTDLTQLDTPPPWDRVERRLLEDPVAVLRPRPAVTLPPEATVGDAIRTLLQHNIGALAVVSAAGELLGIFSERDLLTRVAGTGPDYASRPVSEYMTRSPETVRAWDTLAVVLNKLDVGGYRHLPVVGEGQELGMISVRDMLRHVTRLCQG